MIASKSRSIARELNRADIRQVIVGDCRVKCRTPEVIPVRHGHFLILSIRPL